MNLFRAIASIQELTGLSREEKARVLRACRTAPFKSGKVWLSMTLLFLASGTISLILKLIIPSLWFWQIKSEIVRKVVLEIARWPAAVCALAIFFNAYANAMQDAVRRYRAGEIKKNQIV